MFRARFFLLFTAVLFLFSCLSACSSPLTRMASLQVPPASTSIPPTSLQNVNWSDFTYTFTCYDAHLQLVRVKNGSATWNGIHFSVQKPVFGDLTGDGQAEAAIVYQCSAADTAPARVLIYAGTAQHPSLLATLPVEGTKPLVSVTEASIANETLQLSGYGYTSHDPLCCPSLRTTITYQWDGSSFRIVAIHSSSFRTIMT